MADFVAGDASTQPADPRVEIMWMRLNIAADKRIPRNISTPTRPDSVQSKDVSKISSSMPIQYHDISKRTECLQEFKTLLTGRAPKYSQTASQENAAYIDRVSQRDFEGSFRSSQIAMHRHHRYLRKMKGLFCRPSRVEISRHELSGSTLPSIEQVLLTVRIRSNAISNYCRL